MSSGAHLLSLGFLLLDLAPESTNFSLIWQILDYYKQMFLIFSSAFLAVLSERVQSNTVNCSSIRGRTPNFDVVFHICIQRLSFTSKADLVSPPTLYLGLYWVKTPPPDFQHFYTRFLTSHLAYIWLGHYHPRKEGFGQLHALRFWFHLACLLLVLTLFFYISLSQKWTII